MAITRIDYAGANDLTDNNTVQSAIDTSDAEFSTELALGAIIAPATVSETWQDHFIANNLSTFQDAITAGYSYFLQPSGRQVATFTSANTERLKRTDNASLSITGNITVSAWIKTPSVAAQQFILAKWGSAGARSYAFSVETNSKINFSISTDGTNTPGINSSGTITTDTWYFVVGKYDGSNLAVIINAGTPTTTSQTGSIYDSTNDFFIGARGSGTLGNFGGNIRNVGIWNAALTSDQITMLYNNGVPRYYDQLPLHLRSNLVSYWDLNELSSGAGAITRVDSHTTGNDLTDENTVTSSSVLDVAIVERIIDFGALLSGSIINVNFLETPISDSLTIVTKIATSTDGYTFGAFTTGSSVFATTVQAVKIRFEITPSSNTAFSEIDNLRVKLTVKKTRDNGTISASADDASGTAVTFNKSFLDIETINVTPKTIQRIAFFTAANSESLSLADNATISTGDIDFAIAGWVWFDVVDANRGIFAKWTTSGNQREYALWLDGSTNKIQFDVSNDGSATISRIASTFSTIQKQQWYFVVAEHNASANTISIQINNGAIDSTSHSTGVFNSTAALSLGARDSSNYLDGCLANWGLWKRTLTTGERTTLYEAGYTYLFSEMAGSLTTSLAAFWPLSEASGNRADDVGSNDLIDNNTVTSRIIAKNAYFNFLDVANPTGFDVLVYDSNGIRLSSPVDWTAEGFINPV